MVETFNADEYARYQILEILQTAYARTQSRTEKERHLRQFGENLTNVLSHAPFPPYDKTRIAQCVWYEQEVARITLGHPEEITCDRLEQLIQAELKEAEKRTDEAAKKAAAEKQQAETPVAPTT